MKVRSSELELFGLVAPFGLWGLAFVTLYAAHGAACASGLHGGGATDVRLVLGSLLAAFLSAHVWLALRFWKQWRKEGPPSLQFIRLASLILAIGALATTAWTGFPVLVLSLCV